MKPKQLFILFIILLLALTLLFPKTKEEQHCDQYSGESNKSETSSEYIACNNDTRCEIDKESISPKDTDQDQFSFICVPATAL